MVPKNKLGLNDFGSFLQYGDDRLGTVFQITSQIIAHDLFIRCEHALKDTDVQLIGCFVIASSAGIDVQIRSESQPQR